MSAKNSLYWIFILFVCSQTRGAKNEEVIYTVVGASAHIPCNISAPPNDGPLLVLWYRNFDPQPIYSFDNRFSTTKHWSENPTFGPRAIFRDNSEKPGILSELVISNVRFEDGGYYKCRVDFRLSPTRSETVHLRIIEEPEIPVIMDEDGSSVMGEIGPFSLGRALLLLCVVEKGNPKPRVLWYRNGELWDTLPDPSTYDDIQQNTLIITSLERSHHGNEFSCIANNNNVTGSPKSTIKILLKMPILELKISNLPDPLTSEIMYEVICQASGAAPLPNITWFLNGTPISSFRENHQVSHDGNLTTSSLYFTPKIEDHGKTLTCYAQNALNKLNESRILNVHYLPIVRLEMMNERDYVLDGEDLVLECHIKARPRVWRVLWYQNGKELLPTKNRVIMPEEGTLLLRNVTKEQSGYYLCSATNVEGDGSSKTHKISVFYKPVCNDARVSKSVDITNNREMTTISLGCGVDSKPEPLSFRWLVNSSESATFEIPSAENFMTFSNHEPNEKSTHRGTVMCWASNEIGEQKSPCIFYVVPLGAPHPPSNCKVINHTASTIQVSCTPGFNGGLPQYFVMDIFETSNNNTQILIASNWTEFSDNLKVRGLTPESSYIISIKAVNDRGESPAVYLGGKTQGYIHYLPVKNQASRLPVLLLVVGILVSLMILGICLTSFLAMKKWRKRDLYRSDVRFSHENEDDISRRASLLTSMPVECRCSRKEIINIPSVERTVIKAFSIEKKRPICPVCNPYGTTPYPKSESSSSAMT